MLSDPTVTPFPHSVAIPANENNVTLDGVVQSMTSWRANKQNPQEPIPEAIWDHIFILLNKFNPSTLRASLNITSGQLRRKIEERSGVNHSLQEHKSSPTKIDFCKAKSGASSYKPAKVPATHTVVVEFCRADGRIMKIHTTNESFAELMATFFSE